MKLISYGRAGRESWGVVVEGKVIDLALVSGCAMLADHIKSTERNVAAAMKALAQQGH